MRIETHVSKGANLHGKQISSLHNLPQMTSQITPFHLILSSAALTELAKYIPAHSFTLSSHLIFFIQSLRPKELSFRKQKALAEAETRLKHLPFLDHG